MLEKATKILKQGMCDHCLGRQFAQLGHGYDNAHRGKILRALVAMSIDKEKFDPGVDLSNFQGFAFHHLEKKIPEKKKCTICGNVFVKIGKFASNAIKKSTDREFSTFLVGTQLSQALLEKEEMLWERIGIDNCEPLKAELNREIGKIIEKKTKAVFSEKPEVSFLIQVPSGRTSIKVNPLHIYGEYQKLVRGIPQTRWPNRKYKTSVEEIVAKPFMIVTKSKNHKFHGLGREDIDARCLGWRPFVLTLMDAKKRKIDYKKMGNKISKKVRVRKLRSSNIEEVRKIKESRIDKTYRMIIATDKEIKKSDIKKLTLIVGEIKQKTPQRVLHRRADRYRKRKVKHAKAKLLGPRKIEITIHGEAGLYVKELISGDNGRTKPSVSDILGCSAICKQLDVIKIHTKN